MTRTVNVGQLAVMLGEDTYAAHGLMVGRRAVFTTWEGDRLEGVLERPDPKLRVGTRNMIIRFPDGRWARADDVVELV